MLSPAVASHVDAFHTSDLPTFRALQAAWGRVALHADMASTACLLGPDGLPHLQLLPSAPIKAQRLFSSVCAATCRRGLTAMPPGPVRHAPAATKRRVAQALGRSAFGGAALHELPIGDNGYLPPWAARVAFAIRYLPTLDHLGEIGGEWPTADAAIGRNGVAGPATTHKIVGLEINRMIRDMGYVSVGEVQGFSFRDGRRPDFAAIRADGKYQLYDHTVSHTMSESALGAACVYQRNGAVLAERRKHAHYDHHLAEALGPGHFIVPLAIETTGAWGPEFEAFFTDWVKAQRDKELLDGGSGWAATERARYWQQRVAQAVARCLAQRLAARMDRFTIGNHAAALAAAPQYVSITGRRRKRAPFDDVGG